MEPVHLSMDWLTQASNLISCHRWAFVPGDIEEKSMLCNACASIKILIGILYQKENFLSILGSWSCTNMCTIRWMKQNVKILTEMTRKIFHALTYRVSLEQNTRRLIYPIYPIWELFAFCMCRCHLQCPTALDMGLEMNKFLIHARLILWIAPFVSFKTFKTLIVATKVRFTHRTKSRKWALSMVELNPAIEVPNTRAWSEGQSTPVNKMQKASSIIKIWRQLWPLLVTKTECTYDPRGSRHGICWSTGIIGVFAQRKQRHKGILQPCL